MPADDQPARNAAEPSDSLSKLRAEHVELMRETRRRGRSDDIVQHIRAFINRVKAAGTRIDSPADRDAAQDIITYWASYLFTAGDEAALQAALPILDPFDPANAPDLSRQSNPYHGLAPFSEDDRGRFFGREDAVKAIIDKLREQPMLLISGPAGSGKTSIVAAGIVPRLRFRLIDKDKNPVVLVVHPGGDPFAVLLRRIHEAAAGQSLPELGTWISEQKPRLERAPDQLRVLLEAIFPRRPVILVVDDLDQLLACPDVKTREQFAQALTGVCSDPQKPDRTIVIVDEQYEHAALQLAAFAPFARNPAARFALPPLTAAEVQRVIEGGAAAVGLKFDEGIVEDLAKDVAGDARAPPTLQFTLGRLWNERERDRVTWDAYGKVGKPREALKRTAEAVFDSLSSDEQQIARKLFLELVQPASEGNFTRGRVRRDVLMQIGPQDVVARVVTRYVEAGLIRQTAGIEWGDDHFDVPHEALATSWPRLRDWLQRERTDSAKKLQLVTVARRWRDSGFESSYLLSGAALEEAEAYTGAAPELGLLVAKSNDEGRRARRRAFTRNVVVSTIAALLVVAVWNWKQAREERARAEKIAEIALGEVSNLLDTVDSVDRGTGILPTITTLDLIERAEKILHSLEERQQPKFVKARVELLTKPSDAYEDTGNEGKAFEFRKEAHDKADQFANENDSDEEWQRLLYDSKFRLGDSLVHLHDTKGAEKDYHRALRIAHKWASLKPGDREWQWRRIFIEYKMGEIAQTQRHEDQSRQWFRNALAFSERLLEAQPDSLKWQRYVGNGHHKIGDLLAKQEGRWRDALVEYRIAAKIRNELVGNNSQNRIYKNNLSVTYEDIGSVYNNPEKFAEAFNEEEALNQYEMALKFAEDLPKFDPLNVAWQIRYARLSVSIANIHTNKHEFDAALNEYDEAIQRLEKVTERDAFMARNAPDHLRNALKVYRSGLNSIEAFMRMDPSNGSKLEGVRKVFQDKIENLSSNPQ